MRLLPTKPELNTIEIRQFLIPVPDPDKQELLLTALETACLSAQRKRQEAEDLVNGLDQFVLDALELSLPPTPDNTNTYAVQLRDVVSAGKLYPDYYHPERLWKT